MLLNKKIGPMVIFSLQKMVKFSFNCDSSLLGKIETLLNKFKKLKILFQKISKTLDFMLIILYYKRIKFIHYI